MTMTPLNSFAASDTDYVEKFNANFAIIESFCNGLEAQLVAAGVDGQALLLDLWDRDGLVGPQSYVLDVDNYAGGATITIGRRPVFNPTLGEVDVSIAFGTFGGTKVRVTQSGDVVLNAATIVTGLPKTIYVGIGSNGTPQLYEDTSTINVLYVWSMTWDGLQMTNFKRIAHILDAYATLQALHNSPKTIQIFDPETNFVSDYIGGTEIVLPGAASDNGIDVDGSFEVVGLFFLATKAGIDGFSAMAGNPLPDDVMVRFNIESDGVVWNDTVFEIDASNVPDYLYKKVNVGVVGDDRFVTERRRFEIRRESIGSFVTSARAFVWGLLVRPIIGLPVPRDTTRVVTI
jgi:hypothetical protein